MHALSQNYNDVYCDRIHFPASFDFNGFQIENSTFCECVFDGCVISADTFANCWFYGCHFYNVRVVGKALEDRGLFFNNCDGEEVLKSDTEYRQ